MLWNCGVSPRLLPCPYRLRLGLVILGGLLTFFFLWVLWTGCLDQSIDNYGGGGGLSDEDGPWPGLVYRNVRSANSKLRHGTQRVTLAVVSCTSGVRTVEAITMLKSAILFSKFIRLRIIVVTEKKFQYSWARKMEELLNSGKQIDVEIEYEVYRTWFPRTKGVDWGELWGKCAFQRLFFPGMFKEMDSVLYVDSDSLFLADLRYIWAHFKEMNQVQLAGVVGVSEFPSASRYSQSSKTPYYGLRGLNSGVMLMNLTRMRATEFEDKIVHYWKVYGNMTVWADQDILNVLFHFNPEYVYDLDCRFNFRCCHCECWDRTVSPELCMCSTANQSGVAVLHGNGKLFHRQVTPPCSFGREFYSAMRQYNLSSDQPHVLFTSLNVSLNRIQPQPCALSSHGFLSLFNSYLSVSI